MLIALIVVGWLLSSLLGALLFFKIESYLPIWAVLMSLLSGPAMVIAAMIKLSKDSNWLDKDLMEGRCSKK